MKQFRKMKEQIEDIDFKRLSMVYQEAERSKNNSALATAAVDLTPDDTTNNQTYRNDNPSTLTKSRVINSALDNYFVPETQRKDEIADFGEVDGLE